MTTDVQPPLSFERIVDMDTGRPTLEFYDLITRLWERSGGFSDDVDAGSFVGQVVWTAGPTTPDGYLECNGAEVAIVTYPELAAELGNTWGTPASSSNFVLPDLRGRTVVGAGTGSGLTARTLGQTLGLESVSLTEAQLAIHDHAVQDTGHGHTLLNTAHTHGLTDPGHSHGLTDPGHSHGVTDPGHSHGLTDGGHSHGVTDAGHQHAGSGAANFVMDAAGTEYVNTAGDKGVTAANTASATTGVTVDSATTGATVNSGTTGATVNSATTSATVDSGVTSATVDSAELLGNVGANQTGVTIADAGSGSAHENMQPGAVLRALIRCK